MTLQLPTRFTFADFKRATPIDAATVLSLILSRHSDKMTVRRPAAAHDNLRRIFDATFKLANKVGFAAMTLRDLCRETGLSMGGLYGYLSSKDDLAAIVEDVVWYVTNEIPLWFASISDPRVRLDSTLRAHLFLSELLQPWFYFVFMESRMLPSAQRMIARSSELRFQEMLARLIVEATGCNEESAKLLASHLVALVQDWHLKRWKYRQLKVGVDDFAESLSALFDMALVLRKP